MLNIEHVSAVIILYTCIRDVPGSHLGWDKVLLTEDFHGFPQPLQEISKTVPRLSTADFQSCFQCIINEAMRPRYEQRR
jgi:hypothetical protein